MGRGIKILLSLVFLSAAMFFGCSKMVDRQQTSVNEAASAFVAPSSFVMRTDTITTGLNETVRNIEFESTLSVDDACEQSLQAFANWAQQAATIERETGANPACTVKLFALNRFPDLSSAGLIVFRARSGFSAYDADPGGTSSVRFWVQAPTDWIFRSYDASNS